MSDDTSTYSIAFLKQRITRLRTERDEARTDRDAYLAAFNALSARSPEPELDLEGLAEAVWGAMPAHHTGWRGLSNEDRDFYRGVAARLRDHLPKKRVISVSPVEWVGMLAEAWDKGHDECCAVYVRHCATAQNPYRGGDS